MDIFELKLKSSEEQSTVLISELTNRLKSHNHPFTIFSTRTRKRTVHPHHVLSLLTYVHTVLQDTVQTVLFPRNAVKIATGIATVVLFVFVDGTFIQAGYGLHTVAKMFIVCDTGFNNHISSAWKCISVFLRAFEKLRKPTISFVMSVRPSVRPSVRMEQLDSHWTYFDEI